MFKSSKIKNKNSFVSRNSKGRAGGTTHTHKTLKNQACCQIKLTIQTPERIVCESSKAINSVLMSKDSSSFEPLSMQETLIKTNQIQEINFFMAKQVQKQTSSAKRKILGKRIDILSTFQEVS